MIELILIYQIFLILIIVIGLWLGFWVLFANWKSKSSQTFFLITIFIVLWAIFAHLGFTANESEKAIMWYQLNFGIVSLFFVAAYFFSIYFPREDRSNPILNQVVVFLGITLFSLSVFTNLIIKNVILKPWGVDIVFG